jgi:biopolymer transport protein ExbD
MGMNLGASDTDEDVISSINTTPLVDVMLVLLIIFLITIPVGFAQSTQGSRRDEAATRGSCAGR